MDRLDIILNGAVEGDAITLQALRQQKWLHLAGVQSDIFAEHVDISIIQKVQPLTSYRPKHKQTYVLYHHSAGSPTVNMLMKQKQKIVLVYHNITPSHFFRYIDPEWVHRAELGRQQLKILQKKSCFAFADSQYNATELLEHGFIKPTVLPLTFDSTLLHQADNPILAAQIRENTLSLLFVGRFSPNKKQADLIKLLHCVQHKVPNAHLYLVGDRWNVNYDSWVEQIVATLGLGDSVTITNKVPEQDLVTFYRHCDFYVSMSEHEGFGRPYLESMVFGLPIVAFAEAGTRNTLGNAGILFHEKRYAELAGVFSRVQDDPPLRQRLIQTQTKRLEYFEESRVRQIFFNTLKRHHIINPNRPIED